MKAVRAHEIGGPEVLVYEDVPGLTPGPDQALVEIKAVGVNYTDVSSRKGTNPPPSLPWTPGREASGIVKAVGANVTEVGIGDRVAYAMFTGSYAEEAVVPASLLVPLPESMDFATGAATLLQAMTAHFLTFGITRINPGDRVLVHAGAGGVGLLLIQMLRKTGCLHLYHRFHRGKGATRHRGRSRRRHSLHARGFRGSHKPEHRRGGGQGSLRCGWTDYLPQEHQ